MNRDDTPDAAGRDAAGRDAAGRDAAGRDAAVRAGQLLGAVVARVQDVLPALEAVVDEVRWAWPDAAGREWCDRAALVRRALLHDLDAAVAAARAAETLAHATEDPPDQPPSGQHPGAGAGRPGSRTGRSTGPRLGDTTATRTDDERGMRIATLDDPG